MFDGNLRSQVDRRTEPLGKALASIGITADILTLSGAVLSVAAAVVIGTGYLQLGFVFLILSAIPDLLDGPVAKARGTSSARGAFLDSVSDRFSDLMITIGLGFYFLGGSNRYLAMLPFGIYGAASLISYQRAKAESIGFDAKGGLMERAERVVLLALGLLVPIILIPVLWTVLGLSIVTVIQRFVKVWTQATSRDTRIKFRSRPRYKSRQHAAGSALTLMLRYPRSKGEIRRTHRLRQMSQRSGNRSWFSSKNSE